MITQEQLARWRALADAATPGPWEQVTEFGEWWISGPDIERHFVIDTTNGVNAQNADFIAAAREAVPALLAEVERLRAAPASHYVAFISGKPEPTDAENEAAADRITRMNALYDRFGNDVTTWPDWALVKLDRLQSEQGRYEAQYC